MTTTATTAAPAAAARRPRFDRVMVSEWTKIRSVRSTVWSLILLAVISLGFTALFTALTAAQWDETDAQDRAQIIADPTGMILGSGFFFSQLTICVLGVMVIASEYSTGMIRASLLAVPRRVPMFAAKAVVFGVLVRSCTARPRSPSAIRECSARSWAADCTWPCSASSRSRSAVSSGTPPPGSPV